MMRPLFSDGDRMSHNAAPRGVSRVTLRTAGAGLVLFALLQGCATTGAKKTAKAPTAAVTHQAAVVTPGQKADFDAAMALVEKKEYDKAAELFAKVAEEEPNNAIPRINLALAYEKLGKMKKAEESLKEAIKIDPDNPVADNEYALLYRKTGRFKEARALYEKTLEKYPHFIMMHKNLGVLCDLYLQDYACALKHYMAYSAVKTKDKTVKMWIADLKRRMGK